MVCICCQQLHGLEKVLKKTSNTQGDAVAKTFMDALVAILGGYQSALKLRPVSYSICEDYLSVILSLSCVLSV